MLISGLITKAQSGFFTVQTDHGAVTCQLRGRLKKTQQSSDIATIGDHVQIQLLDSETGSIEKIEPRLRSIIREAKLSRSRRNQPAYLKRELAQVLIANPDQAIFVFAAANPSPRLRMLDRFLVVAESNHVPAVLCINKCDLVDAADLNAQFEVYRNIGYHVLFTSVHTGQGLLELQNLLQGKISILSGPSGVGKSSLLNALQPGLGVAVKSVSSATEKGRHTTVHPELFPLPSGGWLADTPGIRSLALYDLEPVELDAYFVEIAPHVSQCEFSDCSHQHEPGCAVKRALAAGKISLERYNSYLSIYLGEEEI